MNAKFLAALLGGLVAVIVGCTSTVDGGNTFGVPGFKDKVSGKYERPIDQVFEASKEVIKFNGTLSKEATLHSQTNIVKTVEGRVNQRNIWIRLQGDTPNTTEVTVQARTNGGATDVDLAHEIEKQIALKLVK